MVGRDVGLIGSSYCLLFTGGISRVGSRSQGRAPRIPLFSRPSPLASVSIHLTRIDTSLNVLTLMTSNETDSENWVKGSNMDTGPVEEMRPSKSEWEQ